MVYVVPLLSLVVPLLGAFAVARRGGAIWVLPWTLALLAGILWAIWQGRQAQGWDGIGHAILAFLVLAPAILGAWIGTALGWWRRRRGA